jgi:hypothetical protein
MNMGHWWNDTDSDKRKCLEIKDSHCHFVRHKSHIGRLGLGSNPGFHYENRNKGNDDINNKYA